MKRNKIKSALKVSSISTMIQNKMIRNKFLSTIFPDGSNLYSFNGMELSKKEMDMLYPTELHLIRLKGLNPDGTKRFYE